MLNNLAKMATEFVPVGKLKEIMCFPIKSCRGLSISEAKCGEKGLEFDRHWVILNRIGKMVNLTCRPDLAHVVPTMLDDSIRIEAPGMQPLILPLELTGDDLEYVDVDILGLAGSGVHVSKEADEWFSTYLKKPHSFLAFNSNCKPRYFHDHKVFGKMPYVKESDCSAFANFCPYLLTSEASLVALNRHLSDMHCDMKRFRPNLVVEGCEEFAEDSWKWIKIGSTVFRSLNKCGRCPLPNVDPATGERHAKEPLTTLRKFRMAQGEEKDLYKQAPLFGKNLAVETPGVVNQGDIVYASM